MKPPGRLDANGIGHYGQRLMNRFRRCFLAVILVWLFPPLPCPAPLIYVPGEGWRYEAAGEEGTWTRGTAKEQLAVAKEAFENKDYGRSYKAGRRLVRVWPFSDYAPEAQYLVGRCLEARRRDKKAFDAYQQLIDRYPKLDIYDDIVERQFLIANRYLDGQWFRLWGVIPLYPSMDKTIDMYEKIIQNGPYSDVAPQAQMNIATAHTRKLLKDLPSAAKAYEKAADRYSDKPIGRDALFLMGMTFLQQAGTAEYDQSIAAQAISTFADFITLYPTDPRVEEAAIHIAQMKTEQARGSYDIARFYEKKRRWDGALIYYNEVLLKDPDSKYADMARQRIARIKRYLES